MYPNNYFSLFPAFPRSDTVFVAMSFASKFDQRWQKVLAPAISSVTVSGNKLKAERVDTSRIGDSILTELLTHIRSARLIVGDVTSLGILDDRPIRNGNVMYEIGIAHAVRLPEEVLLFRSDSDHLEFRTVSSGGLPVAGCLGIDWADIERTEDFEPEVWNLSGM